MVLRSLAPLVLRVRAGELVLLADRLCDNMLDKDDQKREHSGLGMKTVLSGLSVGRAAKEGGAGPLVVKQIGPKLLDGIARAESPHVKAELLDTLQTCLQRFGSGVPELHGGAEECLLSYLTHSNATVRKRCIQCTAALAQCAGDEVFAHLISAVLSAMDSGDAGTMVQVVGGISRTVGFRLGPYVDQIVPVLFAQLDSASGEEGDVLRESCLQSIESLVKRCPQEIAPMAETALRKSMELLKYEPNVDDDYEDDADDMEEDEDSEEEEEEDSDDYDDFEDDGDDDDDSWKIRRAATRCVTSIVATRQELLETMQTEVADLLVKRFRSESEDNVKIDLYEAFQEILKLTQTAMKTGGAFPQAFVDANIPKIARYLVQYDFKDKSKARSNAFTMLRVLCETFPGCFDDHMERLTVGIVKTLEDKKANATLKIEALSFVQTLIDHHAPSVFFGSLGKLMPAVFACAQDRYFKITAEALRVVAHVAKSIMASPDFDASAFVGTVYKVTLERLSATDQDAEVKQCAIMGMADIIAVLGNLLGAELGACLPILVERLRNEVTRLTAVKAFASIAASPLEIDLSSVLGDVVNELCSFLKKSDRALRQGSLSTLVALASTASASGMNGQQLITEVAPLISDSDLYLSQLALQVCKAMLVVFPSAECAQTLQANVWEPTFTLLQSPLLQNSGAERATMELISQIVAVGAPGFNFAALLPTVTGCVIKKSIGGEGGITRQALSSLAQCVAAMCETATPAEVTKTVDEFIAAVGQEVSVTCLSLLSLGEIGRRADLSSHGALESTVMSVLSDSSEEVKNAASFSLGNIAVGCMDKYLSILLGAITSNPGQQYLLLHSLKEIIKRVSEDESKAMAMTGYTATMLPLLYENANSAEEGVRNVVAECLGKIAILEPSRLEELKAMATSAEASIRQTVATAVRHAVTDQPNAAVDERLSADAGVFLALIDDEDLGVKRAALLTLNTMIHSKQAVVRPILTSLVEKVYRETVIRPELIHKVMLGPFSHIVDDGLDARKAAFECIDTLVANCIDALEPQACLTAIISGLADDYDIKMLSYLILVRDNTSHLPFTAFTAHSTHSVPSS